MTDDAGLAVTSVDGVVSIAGEIDVASAEELARLLAAIPGPLVLDLEGVTFMDSAGVYVLVQAWQGHSAAGQGFEIVAASRCVRRVLEICGLLTMFTEPLINDGAAR